MKITRDRLFLGLAVLCFAAFGTWRIATVSGFVEMDEVVHFLQARHAPQHPFLYCSIWARPLFVLLYTPAAQLPFGAARGFTLILALAAGLLAHHVAGRKGIRWPVLAFVCTVIQPLYIKQSYTVMTEFTLAVLLVLAIHLWEVDRRDLSCLLISLTPLTRPEGFFLGPIWWVMAMMGRQTTHLQRGRRTVLLLVGLAAWSLASWLFCGTPLWFVQNFPWVHHGSLQQASLLDYPMRFPLFASPPVAVLACLGVLALRQRRLQMVYFFAGFVVVLHSILWARGYFGSTGYLRYLVPVSPLIGIGAAAGLESSVELLSKGLQHVISRLRHGLAESLGAVVLTILFGTWYGLSVRRNPVRMPVERPESAVFARIHDFVQHRPDIDAPVISSDFEYYLISGGDPWGFGISNRSFLRFVRNDQLMLKELLKAVPAPAYVVYDRFWMEAFMGVTEEDLTDSGYRPVPGQSYDGLPQGNAIRLYGK